MTMELGEIIKRDFPILQNGICFLDSGASSQKPQVVIDTQTYFTEKVYANVHRGNYAFSQEITGAYEKSREIIANFINADLPEVVFTKSATESINLIAHSFGSIIPDGSEVIISQMEHHANIVPWQLLQTRKNISLKIIPVLDDGELDYDMYEKLLSDKTALVAITHTSNVLGTVVNIDRIVKLAKLHGAKVLVDGSQAIVHRKVDVKQLGVDFYVFTGHKMYAPNGVGILWGKADLLNQIPPFLGGGDMIESVSFDKTTFAPIPAKFEAGTPPIVPAICLGTALEYLQSIGIDKIAKYENDLYKYSLTKLSEITGVRIIGTTANSAPILSFVVAGVHSFDLAELLDQAKICVRVGNHCAQPLANRYGISATIRATLCMYNTTDDVDNFIAGINKALNILR